VTHWNGKFDPRRTSPPLTNCRPMREFTPIVSNVFKYEKKTNKQKKKVEKILNFPFSVFFSVNELWR
jgi:hypothetical protein